MDHSTPVVITHNSLTLDFYLNHRNTWRSLRNIKEKSTEHLLNINNKRNSLYPIIYKNIWERYKQHLACFWISEEIDLSKDLNDWVNKLNDNERFYAKRILSFFASSDFIVNESQEKDNDEVTILEYKFFNTDKMARENIHSEVYANLLETYVKDETEKKELQESIEQIPTIKKKADWFRDFIKNGTFVERIIAETITELLFFSSAFASIFWFKKRGLMEGLCMSNEFISRDEGLHGMFNIHLYKEEIVNKLEDDIIIHMIKEAVLIEEEFCRDALPVTLIGMNSELMCQYVRFVADFICHNLINKKIYNVECPFDWMTSIALQVKVDFFSNRVSQYGKTTNLTVSENQIRFDAEF